MKKHEETEKIRSQATIHRARHSSAEYRFLQFLSVYFWLLVQFSFSGLYGFSVFLGVFVVFFSVGVACLQSEGKLDLNSISQSIILNPRKVAKFAYTVQIGSSFIAFKGHTK